MANERRAERAGAQTGDAGVNVRWDDANMRSVYSNVCNVTGTREEITHAGGRRGCSGGRATTASQEKNRRLVMALALIC